MQKSQSRENGGYHGNESERHWYSQSRMQQYVLVWLFHDLDQILNSWKFQRKHSTKNPNQSPENKRVSFWFIFVSLHVWFVVRAMIFLKPRHSTIDSNMESYYAQKFIIWIKNQTKKKSRRCAAKVEKENCFKVSRFWRDRLWYHWSIQTCLDQKVPAMTKHAKEIVRLTGSRLSRNFLKETLQQINKGVVFSLLVVGTNLGESEVNKIILPAWVP